MPGVLGGDSIDHMLGYSLSVIFNRQVKLKPFWFSKILPQTFPKRFMLSARVRVFLLKSLFSKSPLPLIKRFRVLNRSLFRYSS